MSIRKLTDKPRNLPYRAYCRGKIRMFKTYQEAEIWVTESKRIWRMTGLPPTFNDYRTVTVGQLVEKYLKEKTPYKGCAISETSALNKFLRNDICQLSIAAIKKKDGYKYVQDRLQDTWKGKPITPRTVRREINTLAHIFATAREEWGYDNLDNPFRLRIQGSTGGQRERRLKPSEVGHLLTACKACYGANKVYSILAIILAIETGMRLQELFNLKWEDVHPDTSPRTIRIIKSKTDRATGQSGRTIVCSIFAA